MRQRYPGTQFNGTQKTDQEKVAGLNSPIFPSDLGANFELAAGCLIRRLSHCHQPSTCDEAYGDLSVHITAMSC